MRLNDQEHEPLNDSMRHRLVQEISIVQESYTRSTFDSSLQENYLHASTVDSRILECAVSF